MHTASYPCIYLKKTRHELPQPSQSHLYDNHNNNNDDDDYSRDGVGGGLSKRRPFIGIRGVLKGLQNIDFSRCWKEGDLEMLPFHGDGKTVVPKCWLFIALGRQRMNTF